MIINKEAIWFCECNSIVAAPHGNTVYNLLARHHEIQYVMAVQVKPLLYFLKMCLIYFIIITLIRVL